MEWKFIQSYFELILNLERFCILQRKGRVIQSFNMSITSNVGNYVLRMTSSVVFASLTKLDKSLINLGSIKCNFNKCLQNEE